MNRLQSLQDRLVSMSEHFLKSDDKVDQAAAKLVLQAATDLQKISEMAGRICFVIHMDDTRIGPEMRANMQYTELAKYLDREV